MYNQKGKNLFFWFFPLEMQRQRIFALKQGLQIFQITT